MNDPIAESLSREESPQVTNPGDVTNSYGLPVEVQQMLSQQRFGDALGLVTRLQTVHPKARNVIAQLATQFGNCSIEGNFRNVTDFVVDALIRGEVPTVLTEPAPTSPVITEPMNHEGQVLQEPAPQTGPTKASGIADNSGIEKPKALLPNPTSIGAGVVKKHVKPIQRI